jgi:hypothetical protein
MLGITLSKCTVSRTNLTFPRGRSNFRLAPRCLREINARTIIPMPEESIWVTSVRLTNILLVPSSISCRNWLSRKSFARPIVAIPVRSTMTTSAARRTKSWRPKLHLRDWAGYSAGPGNPQRLPPSSESGSHACRSPRICYSQFESQCLAVRVVPGPNRWMGNTCHGLKGCGPFES